MEALMDSEDGRAWVRHGHQPRAQLRHMGRLLERFASQLVEEAWEACADADAVIGSFTSDAYALAIAEKRDIPVLSAPLQPVLVATRDGRAMVSAPFPDRVSRVNAAFGRAVIETFPWLLYGKHVNAFRRRLGLPSHGLRQDIAARRHLTVLHGVSRHVMPRPADWPGGFHVCGYWFLDEGHDWQPPAALVDFLEAGPPPVGIGFGSMTGHEPAGTTRLLVDAVRQSGQRAVLLAGWAGLGGSSLPPEVLGLAEAPHAWLFPRLAAVVHHGGAGTTAAGLAAGVPSVVVPHFADQFYWGRRVHALGVGPRPLPRHRLTSEGLAVAIRAAVTDQGMRQRAAALGARIREEDGLREAVAIVSQVVRS
jgi:UDP:flavonoid glycosyltransferase YjiC (YdhE family)